MNIDIDIANIYYFFSAFAGLLLGLGLYKCCVAMANEEQAQKPTSGQLQQIPGITTYKLNKIMAHVGECKRKNIPVNLDFIPECVNYIYTTCLDINYKYCRIEETRLYLMRSHTPMKIHLELLGVCDSCYLGFTEEQKKYLELA